MPNPLDSRFRGNDGVRAFRIRYNSQSIRFEYTFELSWNTLKDRLEHDGVIMQSVTPRNVIRTAAATGLVADGQTWIDMLEDRRNISHRYDIEMIENVLGNIRDNYLAHRAEVRCASLRKHQLRTAEAPHRRKGHHHIRKRQRIGGDMKRAYKAILHGDKVEWLDGAPDADGPVPVEITVEAGSSSEPTDEESEPVSELFQELADMGAFADIEDPVAWQQEIRKDRPLPFRD